MKKSIAIDQFVDTYDKYPPNNWIVSAFKYLSKTTEIESFKISRTFKGVFVGMFLCQLISVVFDLPKEINMWVSIVYASIVLLLLGWLGGGVIMNRNRIKKICEELQISKLEYHKLLNLYFD